MGAAPVISFHYGAENETELKNMFRKSMCLVGSASVVLTVLAFVLASPLARIFVGYDEELFVLTRHAFHLFAFSFLLAGFNIFTSSLFTALNNGAVSADADFPDGIRIDPADSFRCGRHLVGRYRRRSVRMPAFDGISGSEEGEISLSVKLHTERTKMGAAAKQPPFSG